jgi:hypothetical protein
LTLQIKCGKLVGFLHIYLNILVNIVATGDPTFATI